MYRLPLYPFSNQNIHSNHRNANHHLGLSGKSRLKGTIEIGRPVEEVFAYVTEPRNHQEWESGVDEELTSEGPIGVGSKGRRVEIFMGRDESVWEVTEWKPNELLAAKFESDKFIGAGEYRTEPTDGGHVPSSGVRVRHRVAVV